MQSINCLLIKTECVLNTTLPTIRVCVPFYQKVILADINDGGGHLCSSSQSSSRESKLAALPSDENPDGDKLSGG